MLRLIGNRDFPNRPYPFLEFLSFESDSVTDSFRYPLRKLFTTHYNTLGPKRFTFQFAFPNRSADGSLVILDESLPTHPAQPLQYAVEI